MTKYLILHGTDASPEDNWFMWLKGTLIGEGNKVWLPQLPHSKEPNADIYTKFILANPNFVINSETVLIGHSSGAVEILRLLEKIEVTVKAAILVSALKDNLGRDSLNGLFQVPFDFETIKTHCSSFVLIHSDNDPYVPIEHAEYLADSLDAELITIEGQGHFNLEQGEEYKQFPFLLKVIASVNN